MKRAPSDKPNLDDVLARDFAELKVGEANIPTEPSSESTEDASIEPAQSSTPIAYNQRIDAVENREMFEVKAPAGAVGKKGENASIAPKIEVLKEASTQPGDDFDVEW